MHHLILAQQPSGDWSLAGSIMTFAIPVGLFVIVAAILYFQYTRPHVTPGHRPFTPAAAGAGAGAGGGTVAAASAAPAAAGPTQAADEAPAAVSSAEGTE